MSICVLPALQVESHKKINLLLCSGLVDEQQKVRTITALALAALAEAATPYGIESFDSVLKPLWKGIRQHRGKVNMSILQYSISCNVMTPVYEARAL